MLRKSLTISAVCLLVGAAVHGAEPAVRSLRRAGGDKSAGASAAIAARAKPAAAVDAAPRPAPPLALPPEARDAARATSGLSRASASLSRVPQAGRAVGAADAASRLPRPAMNGGAAPQPLRGSDAVRNAAERAFDHRIQRAEHLGDIAQRNGNERLADTAERMRDNAQRRFDAAEARLDNMSPAADGDGAANVRPQLSPQAVPTERLRWRDRLHFAWPFRSAE